MPAPAKPNQAVRMPVGVSRLLAYYQADRGPGILAPRGWSCVGLSGSGGSFLFVVPQQLDASVLLHAERFRLSGYVVAVHLADGESSGRFEVAQVIARVFPAHKAFVDGVIYAFDFFAPEVTWGPYPGDKLHYLSGGVVEYSTPPNSEGLGTQSPLKPNDQPIVGAAILQGQTPDLVLLSMRLPPKAAAATTEIIKQMEVQAERGLVDR